MKRVVLTGGGTGGHIYPLLAVARQIKKIGRQDVRIYYLGQAGRFEDDFLEENITIYNVGSSKFRRYFSLLNVADFFRFFWGILVSLRYLYSIMPDIVFSKGGPGALPVVLAARFYFIPVIIHESDSIPGLTNRISAKFSKKIAVGFREAEKLFPRRKVIFTGNPVREVLVSWGLTEEGARHMLNFPSDKPTLFVTGGSQGSARINSFILKNLEYLLSKVNIYHQVGPDKFEEIKEDLKTIPGGDSKSYRPVPYINAKDLKAAYMGSDVILSRAGGSAIYEIAYFNKPSILVPLPETSSNRHQLANAYEYAKATGCAHVVEENNLTKNIVIMEIEKMLNPEFSCHSSSFFRPDAAEVIAKEIYMTMNI